MKEKVVNARQNTRLPYRRAAAALSVSTIINGERAGARKCRIVRVHSSPRGFTVIIKSD